MAGIFRRNAPSEPTPAEGPAFDRLRSPSRPQNTPWIIAGVVLVVLSGLAAASLISDDPEVINRTELIIAARSIAEGRVITEDDLEVASVRDLSPDMQVMAPETLDEIVGRVAAGPIGSGSAVHPDQFIIGGLGQEPTVVVGASLGPDEYPLLTLRPGDRVRVIEVRIDDLLGDEGSGRVRIDGRELAVAQVVSVRPLGQESLHFSLRIGESAANVVLDRIARGRVSLALIDEDTTARPSDALEPAAPAEPADPAPAPTAEPGGG